MEYSDFIKKQVINHNTKYYELLIESVTQIKLAPSVYLKNQLTRQQVSQGLKTLFGNLEGKPANVSVNSFLYNKYQIDILHRDDESRVKICSACDKELLITNFYSNGYQPNGKKKYKPKCKECESLTHNKEFKELLVALKGTSCKICNYSKCYQALEFHHLDPTQKEYQISNLKSHSLDTIKLELDKCILVCANCHREIHYGFYPEYLLK